MQVLESYLLSASSLPMPASLAGTEDGLRSGLNSRISNSFPSPCMDDQNFSEPFETCETKIEKPKERNISVQEFFGTERGSAV